MKLPWLKSAVEKSGPFTTVYLDTTRIEPNAAAEIETRWSNVRSSLAAEGAPDAVLAEIEDTLLEPSSLGGRHGRAIIATDQQILVDRVLPVPPLLESAHRGDFPQLLPLLQLTPFAVSQLLIVVDRAGADLHLRAPQNPSIVHAPNDLGEDATVEGGHDELHKASVGAAASTGGARTTSRPVSRTRGSATPRPSPPPSSASCGTGNRTWCCSRVTYAPWGCSRMRWAARLASG